MSQLGLEQKIAAIRRFTRFFGQRLSALEAGPAGSSYSATEIRVLTELAASEARTVTALSRGLGLDAGYLSRVIRRLEQTGIVAKSADASDSRQQPLSLTEAGRAEVRTIEAITTARYAALVRTLPTHIHAPLLDAMERIEGAFGTDVPARDPAPWLLRPHRPGDIAYVTQRTIASVMEEFEFNAAYEIARLEKSAAFLSQFDAERDCAWVAERDGVVVGWVLVERADAKVARLSLLHVESQARGIGIGRRLIAEAIQFATRAGYATLRVELFDPMKTARLLVHGAGFNHTGESPHVGYGRAMHRQEWELRLRVLSLG
ncbi:MAG: GNAT family N-acetyltransferase [Gemmatimonadaceae bacterium]|nr:GNAT family N-acetyltransferase [Gemmatimonadaceae bacterium]